VLKKSQSKLSISAHFKREAWLTWVLALLPIAAGFTLALLAPWLIRRGILHP
jgi:hypothetical protein